MDRSRYLDMFEDFENDYKSIMIKLDKRGLFFDFLNYYIEEYVENLEDKSQKSKMLIKKNEDNDNNKEETEADRYIKSITTIISKDEEDTDEEDTDDDDIDDEDNEYEYEFSFYFNNLQMFFQDLFKDIIEEKIDRKYVKYLSENPKYSSFINNYISKDLPKYLSGLFFLYRHFYNSYLVSYFNPKLIAGIIMNGTKVALPKLTVSIHNFLYALIQKKNSKMTELNDFLQWLCDTDMADYIIGDVLEAGFTIKEFKKLFHGVNREFDSFLDERGVIIPSDTTHINDDILLKLESMERENRIGKVLYKGEAREKGKIYNDTIQKYLTNYRNSSKTYSVINGKKQQNPISPDVQLSIEYLVKILGESQQSGFITMSHTKDNIRKIKPVDTNFEDYMIDFIKKYADFGFNISTSKYTGSSMQTLIPPLKKHNLFEFHITNLKHLKKYLDNHKESYSDDDIGALLVVIDEIERGEFSPKHQTTINKNNFPMGFVRYQYEGNNIWVNTIQSDISEFLNDNEAYDKLYYFIVKVVIQQFIKVMHKKGFTQIVIPTSKTRGTIFGEHNQGFVSAYDNIPKLLGFEKVKMGDTIWINTIQKYEPDVMRSEILAYSTQNVWVLNGLNENKLYHGIEYLMESILNPEVELTPIDKIRLKYLTESKN